MAPLAVGSDTGGSIRQPAAVCGIVGLKPTYGRVSRYGLVAFASSLDQLGPLAWTVTDVALLLESMAGHDPRDSTSANVPVPAYSQLVQQPLKNLRLGVCPAHFDEGLDHQVASLIQAALDVYRSLGAEIREVALQHSPYAIAAYYIVAPSEASSNLARYDGVHYGYRAENAEVESAQGIDVEPDEGPLVRMYRRSRAEGFGAEVKRRIMLGTYALSSGYYDAYYLKALKVRRLIREDYDRVFGDVDFLIGPATPTPAFKLGAMANDPLALYLQDLYTVSANLAGVPSISIPCGLTVEGLPVGLQLQGPVFQEDRLLRAAHMYQQVTDWHTRRPVLA
jgi:aspartyl-tRNA(Asn)/glutamyl-tRNA(Gln) amidotransferase subunit A